MKTCTREGGGGAGGEVNSKTCARGWGIDEKTCMAAIMAKYT